ncbi:MAG: tetratricopeptide repeat protein [Candidatus Sulfotelmatobacter sp.]
MKKWTVTILAALATLALALTAHWWAPWLLSFATTNKDDIEHLNTLAELISKLVMWPVTALLFVIGLWQRKKESEGKQRLEVKASIVAQGNVSVGGDAVAGNKSVAIQGDAVSGDKIVYESTPTVLPSPHQLPPPPADFTGRTAELAELRAAIEKGGIHISGLQGQGGVGKTALALKLAAELAPNFPDAQIYLDLKGVSEKPLTAAEAMSHVLRTFHPEAKLPEKEEDLHALYLSVLHNKRALLLTDNAKDAAQVKPLTPPAGCTLLVTSRQHFALPGLQAKNLETLPPPDANDLLLRIAPRIKGEAENIARLCGYLPQALRLAASAIAVRVNLDPREYAKQFADEKKRLELLVGEDESVAASITLSYNLLDAETQERWRMLAVFPDTFNSPAAAAVWEIETDAAQDTLSRLLQYSTLQWNDETNRYRLHDLMRDFGRRLLTPDESDVAARRHATHYGGVLSAADDLYLKGGDSTMRGLALFDLEWGNVRAGQAWAAAHAARDSEAARLCSGYPNWGIYALNLRQSPRDRIRWHEAGLVVARQLQDRAKEGLHLMNLGHAYDSSGDGRRAIEYYEEALPIIRELGKRRSEGQALTGLGNAYHTLGNYRRAIEYYEQHLAIAREIAERRGEADALGNLGTAYYSLGDFRRAIEYYEKALVIDREIGDLQGEGIDLSNMSTTLYNLGDRKKAIEHAEAALKIFEEIESPNAAKVRKQLDIWRNG